MSTPNLELARRFVQAVEQGATGDALLESAARGKKVITSQLIELRNAVAAGDCYDPF
jgi:hypothetical protein